VRLNAGERGRAVGETRMGRGALDVNEGLQGPAQTTGRLGFGCPAYGRAAAGWVAHPDSLPSETATAQRTVAAHDFAIVSLSAAAGGRVAARGFTRLG